ncbi:hypothetical protein Clacol_001618 [Clathrus columnatus]|uniref:Uncharacterized protein n=1 Tax=Clathrus columnatus TaxID=1419009 RepID=A0AAV5A488_9AGAM|nr:hypothetical protein Clacol_001618 [Clathrus columnatus]
MAAPHCIYTDEMTGFCGLTPSLLTSTLDCLGSPLWEPDCRPHEITIGDVGYIRQGRFCRLFNATLPPGDPRNEFGTPDGFETLILDERAMISRRLLPGPLVSRSIVKSGADIEFNGVGDSQYVSRAFIFPVAEIEVQRSS